jgi:hypothetical protein
MLQPPSQPPEKPDAAPKRSEAVFKTDQLLEHPTWKRVTTFWFEGEDYQYVLEAIPTVPGFQLSMTEAEARRKLFGPHVDADIQRVFLSEVALDMTRPH